MSSKVQKKKKNQVAKAVKKLLKPKQGVKKKKVKATLNKYYTPGPSKMERKAVIPAAYVRSTFIGKPRINKGKTFNVCHREYLADITCSSTSAFVPVSYSINPGLSATFPWLGTIGTHFDEYRIRSIRFVYRNRTSTTTSAQILMATQYDSRDDPFASKQEMYEYAGAQSEVAYKDSVHNCNLKRGDYMKKYFIRTGTQPTNTDIREYDVGKFTIAAVGGTAILCGELFVEYDVDFFNPKSAIETMGWNWLQESAAFANFTTNFGTNFTILGSSAYWPFPTTTPVFTASSMTMYQTGCFRIMYARTSNDSKTPGWATTFSVSNCTVIDSYGTTDITAGVSLTNIYIVDLVVYGQPASWQPVISLQASTSVGVTLTMCSLPIQAFQAEPTLRVRKSVPWKNEFERAIAIRKFRNLEALFKSIPIDGIEVKSQYSVRDRIGDIEALLERTRDEEKREKEAIAALAAEPYKSILDDDEEDRQIKREAKRNWARQEILQSKTLQDKLNASAKLSIVPESEMRSASREKLPLKP